MLRVRTEQVRRPSLRCADALPDLSDRIMALGLQDEYDMFRERYLGWRRGKAQGAKGEPVSLQSAALPAAGPQDFGYWYPNLETWQWRRTISFWIGLTFFEGAVFYTMSSFLGMVSDLGDNAAPLTTGGLVWGKLHFIICTYLMVLGAMNVQAEDVSEAGKAIGDIESNTGHGPQAGVPNPREFGQTAEQENDGSTCSGTTASPKGAAAGGLEASSRFVLNPFAYRTAIARLRSSGAGPWPYVAALVYFTGCLSFGLGLLAELTCPDDVAAPLLDACFLLGSFQFVMGGLAECIENEVFTSLSITTAWTGSLLNFLAGLLLLLASVLAFIPAVPSFWASLGFGVGSALFVLGGSIQLVLWRDEQFGLTYMGVINKLGGSSGRPLVSSGADGAVSEEVSFSCTGLFFIHLFSVAAAISCYDFNMRLVDLMQHPSMEYFHRAVCDLTPAVILHMEIALRSAVVRTPPGAPYRQLFVLMRIVATFLVVNSGVSFIQLVLNPGATEA
ncbi:unnamed protein product [Prorocentrum cordatum]|uniref:Solute carrier family 40 protein n=1 Tax=Prorocentrum cordatum TaxID=2364126 RepID=A0ABN9TKC5_9DINO|nr:unnamed protein product [Polarella glacialis]